jgi:hypothetical protein
MSGNDEIALSKGWPLPTRTYLEISKLGYRITALAVTPAVGCGNELLTAGLAVRPELPTGQATAMI